MPFSAGTFSRIYNWATEGASPPISIAKLDTQEADVATALSNCILRDGTGLPTATTPWNSQSITGVANMSVDRVTVNGGTVPTNGMYLSAANTVAWASNTTLRGSVNSTGNWSLVAASAGTTFTVAGGGAAITGNSTITGTLTGLTGLTLSSGTITGDGSTITALNATQLTTGTVPSARVAGAYTAITAIGNTGSHISLGSAGNVTINAPSSGAALTVTQIGSTASVFTAAGTSLINMVDSADSVTMQLGAYSGGGLLQTTTNSPIQLWTNSTLRMTVAAAGNVTINNPTSGVALTISGGGLSVTGTSTLATTTVSGTSGVSFTVNATSGTHSTQIADSANTKYNAGYLELPVNNAGATYTAVLADSGKELYYNGTGATTYTIPANASVAYPTGTTLTFCNDATGATNMTIAITTDTLVLTPGGSTGSRTLAQYGRATAHKVTATRWFISGTGLS